MTIAASAFPRLSPSGLRVVAGEKILVIDQSIEVGPGAAAQWASETQIYYTRQPDGVFMSWEGGHTVVRRPGFNSFSVGGPGRWAGYNADEGVTFDNGTQVPEWSSPALSDDPSVWAALVHNTGRLLTGVGTPARYASGNCNHPRYCGRALAWNVFVDGRWQIAGMREPGATPTLLNVDREEFFPVPLLVSGELWLMTHTHDRLLLRPWDRHEGYVVATGTTSFPDAKQLPDGRIRIVWDALNDRLGEAFVDPSAPREDLLPGAPPPIVVPPPPPPPVDPPPVKPPQETPVRLEQKHSDVIEAFAAKFPPPGHNEDALRDHWTPKLVEQMVFSFPNEGWCWKSTSPGGRPSSDVIARRVGGGMWGYDLIPNAGTGAWRLDSHAGPIDLRTQAPIEMRAVNHLGAAPPVTPPTSPPTTPPVTPPASGVTFPTGVEMPEDVSLSVIDGYLAGIRERDKVRGQDVVPSRGALMYLFAIFFRELSSWIVEKKRAPQGAEWWEVRNRIVLAAVKYYQDRQGVD